MINKELQNRAIEKARMKMAISNFEKEDIKMNKPKRNLLKMVATFVLALGVTSGLVYATGTVIDKIWKEPKKYVINQEITEEEKSQCISEEKAEEIGNSYLKQIGFTDDTIKSLNLVKEFYSNNNVWSMSSDKATIRIDGITGKINYIQIPTWEYKIPYNYGISRVQAREVAWQLLEKYKPADDEGEYEMVTLRRNMETDEGSYIWYVDFYKKYGDLLNENEAISIGWIPTINGLYSLSFKTDKYENNNQLISKDDALKIVVEKDKKIETIKPIINTKAELKIKQMNENVYLRETNKEEYETGRLNIVQTGENTFEFKEDAVFYETEGRVRKVWCVVVEYEIPENSKNKMPSYTYYVDCTTGEIIGGERYDELYVDEQIKEDQYNLIEK